LRLQPTDPCQHARGVRNECRFVTLAAEWHRREVRCISLHEQPIRWNVARYLSQFIGFREGQDAGEANMAADRDGRLREHA
jgi:hypothetical protein